MNEYKKGLGEKIHKMDPIGFSVDPIGLGADPSLIGLESADGVQIVVTLDQALEMETVMDLAGDAGQREHAIPLPTVDGLALLRIRTFFQEGRLDLHHVPTEEFLQLFMAANYLLFERLLTYLVPQLGKRLLDQQKGSWYADLSAFCIPAMVFLAASGDEGMVLRFYDEATQHGRVKMPFERVLLKGPARHYRLLGGFSQPELVRQFLAYVRDDDPYLVLFSDDEAYYAKQVQSILEEAVNYANLEVVRVLLHEYSASLSSALTLAGRSGHLRLVMELVTYPGADPDDAFQSALAHDQGETVRMLLPYINPLPQRHLEEAVSAGHPEVVRALLRDGRTIVTSALLVRAIEKDRSSVVKVLLLDARIDAGVDSNRAIRYATRYGHAELLDILLTRGDVDPAVNNNEPLLAAATWKHYDMVNLLLHDSRVNPNRIRDSRDARVQTLLRQYDRRRN